MYKKVLTIDCPSCKDMFIDDENNFRCGWGKSKNGKILNAHKGKKPRICRLVRGE